MTYAFGVRRFLSKWLGDLADSRTGEDALTIPLTYFVNYLDRRLREGPRPGILPAPAEPDLPKTPLQPAGTERGEGRRPPHSRRRTGSASARATAPSPSCTTSTSKCGAPRPSA